MEGPILLATLNAKYSHCAFGLRYLYANLSAELQSRAVVREFTIAQSPRDIAEKILAESPALVGFGVYIWNARQTEEVISILKKVRPDLVIVLGGPEVSFETEGQSIVALADYVVCGEAEILFERLCREILVDGRRPVTKVIRGELPEIKKLALPYPYYSDDDIRNRVIYVEASRGCPYKCEYCLSSLDKSVRNFELEGFLGEMDGLIQRGARQFKFVDRTFNLSVSISSRILEFFLERIGLGLFLHFELVPDRLPPELKRLIEKFPRGSLQFEIGVQTWSPEVSRLVSRRQDYTKIRENFRYLREETGVHTHADLIAGLPGETWESFARGFDELASLRPDEIQVGILKRLKGTPIIRHDSEWEMKYQEAQPFQVLSTKTLGFAELQELGRFSQYWDLVANSGNFVRTMELVRELAASRSSLFAEIHELSRFLHQRHGQGNGIALLALVESVWLYLTSVRGVDVAQARAVLVQDYAFGTTRRSVPRFLLDDGGSGAVPSIAPGIPRGTPQRQARHLSGQT